MFIVGTNVIIKATLKVSDSNTLLQKTYKKRHYQSSGAFSHTIQFHSHIYIYVMSHGAINDKSFSCFISYDSLSHLSFLFPILNPHILIIFRVMYHPYNLLVVGVIFFFFCFLAKIREHNQLIRIVKKNKFIFWSRGCVSLI